MRDEKGHPYRIAGLVEASTSASSLSRRCARARAIWLKRSGWLEWAVGPWISHQTSGLVRRSIPYLGLEKSEFGGTYKAFVACVHPDDRRKVLRIGGKARKDGQPFDLEYRIVTWRGEPKVIREIGGPIKDDEGRVVGLIGTAQDITGRKQAEELLMESEIRYRSLFEDMSEGFVFCRVLFEHGRPRDFIYLEVNRAFEKMTGLRNVVRRKGRRTSSRADSRWIRTFGSGMAGWS